MINGVNDVGYEIVNIIFPTGLDKVVDITNDNIDVDVYLNDGHRYSVVVSTPKSYLTQMSENNIDYIEAGPPDIIVKCLTEDNIQRAIESYLPFNAYWLKVYTLAGDSVGAFDIKVMNEMMKLKKKKREEIFDKDV